MVFTHFCKGHFAKNCASFKCQRCLKEFPNKKEFYKHFLQAHFKAAYEQSPPAVVVANAAAATSKDESGGGGGGANKDEDSTSNDGSLSDAPLPAARTRRTLTASRQSISLAVPSSSTPAAASASAPPKTARQKIMQEFQNNSIDYKSFEFDNLKAELARKEAEHAEELKKKDKSFERWIKAKEEALETEEANKKLLQDRLEQAHVDVSDLRKQLEIQQESYKNLEAMMMEEHAESKQLSEDKKELEKTLEEQKRELTSANVLGQQFQSDADAANLKLKEKTEELEEAEANLNEKDDKIKELEKEVKWEKANGEKAANRLEKQLESHKNKLKALNEDKGNRVALVKELNAKLKEQENQHGAKLKELEATNERLRKEVKTAPTKSQLETSSQMAKKFQEELSTKEEEINRLQSQKSSLLDLLEKLQKTMVSYDELYAAKNKEISDANNQSQEYKLMLDEASEELEELKSSDKEKKELQKRIKTLQKESKAREDKQFSQVRLISGLQKEKAELTERLQKSEDFKSESESQIKEVNAKMKRVAKELEQVKAKRDTLETELAKGASRVQSKTEEVQKLAGKLKESEERVRCLERELREQQSKQPDSSQQQSSSGAVAERLAKLEQQVNNKEAELTHLRRSFETARMESVQRKTALDALGKRFNSTNERMANLTSEHKTLQDKEHTLMQTLKTAEQRICRMDKVLDTLKASPMLAKDKLQAIETFIAGKALLEPGPTRLMIMPLIDQIAMVSQAAMAASAATAVAATGSASSLLGAAPIKVERMDDSMMMEQPSPPKMSPASAAKANNTVDAHRSNLIFRKDLSQVLATEPNMMKQANGGGGGGKDDDEDDDEVMSDTSDEDVEIDDYFEPHRNQVPMVFNHNVPINPPPPPPPPRASSGGGAGRKQQQQSAQLEDVTDKYAGNEDENIVCDICHDYDPPLEPGQNRPFGTDVEWVGCNCERWFHKDCARRFCNRITAKFSCKSVKMLCIGQKPPRRPAQPKKRQQQQQQRSAGGATSHTLPPLMGRNSMPLMTAVGGGSTLPASADHMLPQNFIVDPR